MQKALSSFWLPILLALIAAICSRSAEQGSCIARWSSLACPICICDKERLHNVLQPCPSMAACMHGIAVLCCGHCSVWSMEANIGHWRPLTGLGAKRSGVACPYKAVILQRLAMLCMQSATLTNERLIRPLKAYAGRERALTSTVTPGQYMGWTRTDRRAITAPLSTHARLQGRHIVSVRRMKATTAWNKFLPCHGVTLQLFRRQRFVFTRNYIPPLQCSSFARTIHCNREKLCAG